MIGEKKHLSSKYFWAFVCLSVVLWTILPTVIRDITPMDSTEGAMWGQYLTWGYTRDPWLNAWLTRLALLISKNHDWSIYLFSQLAVATCFWAVWRLGRLIFNQAYALIAVLMLFGIQYYNIAAVDFNDNVCELALWPLIALYAYRSCTTMRLKHWILLGIFAGLGLMAKYYTAFPLLAMFVFMLLNDKARLVFKKPQFFISLATFAVIIAPHFIWLYHHDYLTLRYSLGKVENSASFLQRHFAYALHFLLAQLFTFLGAVILFLFACLPARRDRELVVDRFNWQFLLIIGLGPLFITLLISIVFGWKLNTMWGTPLQSLWPLILLAVIRPMLSCAKLKRFLSAVFVVTVLIAIGYSVSLSKKGSHSSANYPLRQIALQATTEWHQRFGSQLYYVAGPNKVASYITRYSKDRPMALIDFKPGFSPWINLKDFNKKGALFIVMDRYTPISAQNHNSFPKAVLAQYPRLIVLPPRQIAWLRAKPGQAPFYYQIGFLPPKK